MRNKCFTIVLLGLSLSACSFTTSRASSSIPLPALVYDLSAAGWNQINQEPLVYKKTSLNEIQNPTREVFLTSLKECGYKKGLPVLATTRQLFVGLEDLKILNQEKIPTAFDQQSEIMSSSLRAKIDQTPVLMNVLSINHESCTYNIALWIPFSPTADQPSASEQAIIGYEASLLIEALKNSPTKLLEP